VPTTDQPTLSAERLSRRLGFETLLADLSSRFINLSPADVDREIEDALRRVCELVGIDMAVLWQWTAAAPGVITPTHAYPASAGLTTSGLNAEEQFPWTLRQMLAGQMVAMAFLGELPPEAVVDRETARHSGIKSSLILPLSLGGELPVGALALNTLRAERAWPDAVIKRLQLAAQVFTNALARRRSDQALRESEARLAAGADLAGLAFYDVDFGTGVIYVDNRLRDICGVPPERDTGLGALEFWLEHLHPDDRPRVLDEREQMHSGRKERISVEYRFLNPARGARWIHHAAGVAARNAAGRATRTFGVLLDVTERKQAEDELRSLSRRLIRAQEEERALLARELHDDVTQRLAVLAIDAGRAELAGSGGAPAETMKSLREGLVRLSEDIHALAYQLHPSVLEELGLVEALRTECERRGRQNPIAISLDLAPSPPVVGKDAALCLYRVAQEALSNVMRHAHARAVDVVLREMDGCLLLAVRDDGVGFDPESPKEGRSLGLASMRERLRLVNGTLDIESAPGRGTAIMAWVPGEGEPR
jgi:PAS domain S-box-containing protein